MKPNSSYIATKSFFTRNINDEPLRFERGETYFVNANREVIDTVTGAVFGVLKNHVSVNPSWYFDRVGEMAYTRSVVTQYEYIRELVRGNDGMDFRALYEIALDEVFGPCGPLGHNPSGKAIPESGFTRCLTDVVVKGPFEMRKDGMPVKGEGHNARNCTFHRVVVTKGRDGWAA